ncbi:MAG: exonuclease domain-containing protein [Betaproteobacteria bacterium]
MQLLEAPLAIVDLETTGTRPAADRITEIGVLEVDRFEVTSQWSTLVNPGRAIPGEIQALTGITQDMAGAAPRFADLAAELHERLAGRVFIAHNVRFDYAFLKREFDRVGIAFQARTLCSVRLSRRLYRGEREHHLDALIDRHGIACSARHRAMGDADVVWQFLQLAAREHGEEVLAVAARQVSRTPSLPPPLDRAAIDEVPHAAGVYLLYGEAGVPLYVGKSRDLRTRVLAHFVDPGEWVMQVRRIDWRRTAGELGALLLEAKLVKALDPSYNRQLRKPHELCGFVFDGKRLRLARTAEIDAETLPWLRGVFRSRRAALAALHALADEHRLCLRTLGFEAGSSAAGGRGACFRCQIGRCAGVCAGRESVHVHHGRVALALAQLKAADWPHRGPLGIVEKDRARERSEIHVVDRWCYVGTASSDGELAELLEERGTARFDCDHYRILSRHLARPGVQLVPLGG